MAATTTLVLARVAEHAAVHRLGGIYDASRPACGAEVSGEPRYVGTAADTSPAAALAALAELDVTGHRLCRRCFGAWA
jgi:hypothetical protein